MQVFINLGRREDRRFEVLCRFEEQGMNLERFPAVDGSQARNIRGHKGKGRYGCSLSHRLAIREARARKAPAVLIFEDDAIPHPDFRLLAEALIPPDDWGVIYYGCTHIRTPRIVAPGWVRVVEAHATHAYAVRREYYGAVLAALRETDERGRMRACDVALTRLAGHVPMYACYPNLVWQGAGFSDLRSALRVPYSPDGRQTICQEVLEEIDAAMLAMTAETARRDDAPPLMTMPESR